MVILIVTSFLDGFKMNTRRTYKITPKQDHKSSNSNIKCNTKDEKLKDKDSVFVTLRYHCNSNFQMHCNLYSLCL